MARVSQVTGRQRLSAWVRVRKVRNATGRLERDQTRSRLSMKKGAPELDCSIYHFICVPAHVNKGEYAINKFRFNVSLLYTNRQQLYCHQSRPFSYKQIFVHPKKLKIQ